jgi:Domain of unknown function (DUF1937)
MTPFWYLATPYSRYEEGFESAHRTACREASRLLDAGILVFSAIAHTHSIQKFGGPRPHDFWMRADFPFMEAAYGIIVSLMPGWDTSEGVRQEREYFRSAGKPERVLDPAAPIPYEWYPPAPRRAR